MDRVWKNESVRRSSYVFSYLIGEHDLPIISEMLARRVSKLKIEHDNRAIEADYGSLIALAQARVFPTLHYYRSAISCHTNVTTHFPIYRSLFSP